MPYVSKRSIPIAIENKIYDLLIKSIEKLSKKYDIVPFLSDILYPTERVMIAKRLSIAYLLLRGDYDHRQVAKLLRVSTNTVARVSLVLKTQGKGYRLIVERFLKEEALRTVLNELIEGLTPLPPKGANWGEWQKRRRERRRKLTSF